GRSSIYISADATYRQLRQKEAKKKSKQVPLKRKTAQPPNYEKEREYFQEVDSFELLEESPSPKNFGTWVMDNQNDEFVLTHLSSRLGAWLAARKLNYSCGPSGKLSNILETPSLHLESIRSEDSVTSNERTPRKTSGQTSSSFLNAQNGIGSGLMNTVDSEDIGDAIKRLSLSPQPASFGSEQEKDPYVTLLRVCEQSTPSTLLDVLSKYCDPGAIVKVGEGTYGEAFKVGDTVCKIVPFDGDLLVNGEVQKRSAELLEEVLVSKTLNCLRGHGGHVRNSCTTFIETMDLRVCQGSYDASLIKAWEDWDAKHGSENDNPKDFPEKQCYTVFVLAHGGKDLENYVLLNFDEAQSLLVQVTAALAVAEAAYEFEHRDLHWGNILLVRNEVSSVPFTLEGRKVFARSFGLSVSIIDYTLSRLNTGESIHYLDLCSDPELFNGRKGDRQAETYRKMREITEDCWQESCPKTNVLWLQYLVDILLLKKSYKRSSKDERDLRSLKKRLNDYSSAKEALSDAFFSDLMLDQAM
ncbi:Serine/threonine-protein kinase haspin-like protein, partial [Thalictrum thalictroides]